MVMKYIGKGIKKGIKIGKTYLEAIDTGLPRIKNRTASKSQIDAMKKRRKSIEYDQSTIGRWRSEMDKNIDKKIKKAGREPHRMKRHDEKVKEALKKYKGK